MADVVANIGLGSALRGRGPDYSSTALRAYGTVGRYQKKEAPEKLINLDDFKLGTDNLYPVYAKQVGEVVKEAANDYVEIKNRVGDPVKARNIWEAQKAQYQERINPLLSANATLKKVAQSEGTLFPNRDKVMAAANRMDVTPREWASLADTSNGLITNEGFAFDLPLIKEVDLSKITDNYKHLTREKLGGVQYVPDPATGNRRAWQETVTGPTEEAVDKATDDILNDVNALQTFRYRYGDIINKKYPDAKLINSANPDDQDRAHEALRSAVKEMVVGKFGSKRMLHPYADNPPRETQTDKNKKWEVDGTTYRDAKNSIGVSDIDQTDIPEMVGLPALRNNKNLKVFTFSHTDVAENRPLLFVDKSGNPVEGTFRGVIADAKNFKNSQIAVAIKVPSENENGNKVTKTEWRMLPYNPANKDVIKNEFKKTAEEALEAVSGKTGTVTDESVKSVRKSSGESAQKSEVKKEVQEYTREELKKLSSAYTDDVIDAAVKAGKIKLKASKKSKPVKRNFTYEEIEKSGTK